MMNISIDDVRAGITAVSFLLFLAIVWWAYSGRRKQQFEEAARLVLDDDPRADEGPAGSGKA
jgi:cytochrome c oxidase cbb3-type subunit IV